MFPPPYQVVPVAPVAGFITPAKLQATPSTPLKK